MKYYIFKIVYAYITVSLTILGKLLKLDKSKSQHLRHVGDKDNFGTLIELLDGVVRLYHIAAHRQLEKVNGVYLFRMSSLIETKFFFYYY